MYIQDQGLISQYANLGADETFQVVKFVLVSIQRQFYLVEPIMRGKEELKGTSLMHEGIDYAWNNRETIHDTIFSDAPVESILAFLTTIPGIGIPKAGFIVQLCLGIGGCLDTHNLRMYGLEPRQFRTPTSYTRLVDKCKTYLFVCEQLGGSEQLWDKWCEFIADKYPQHFENADHVSLMHVSAIHQ